MNLVAAFLLPILAAASAQVAKYLAELAGVKVPAVAAQLSAAAFAFVIAHFPGIAPYVQLYQAQHSADVSAALAAVLAPVAHDVAAILTALKVLLAKWIKSLGGK